MLISANSSWLFDTAITPGLAGSTAPVAVAVAVAVAAAPPGWTDLVTAAASSIAICAALVGLFVFVFGGADWIANVLAWRSIFSPRKPRPGWNERRRFANYFRWYLKDFRGLDPRPAAVLARMVAHQTSTARTPVAPWKLFGYRAQVARLAVRLRRSILGRLLAPDLIRRRSDLFDGIAQILADYEYSAPVSRKQMADTPETSRLFGRFLPDDSPIPRHSPFSSFVSALSGAVVFVDVAQSRSGYANDVRVWHDSRYVSQAATGTLAQQGLLSFFDEHRSVRGRPTSSCDWESQLLSASDASPTDFDGRNLNLKSVQAVRDRRTGEISFVLMTDETCYAATEYSPQKCKRLEYSESIVDANRWKLNGVHIAAARGGETPGRIAMLTAFAAIVLHEFGAKRASTQFVLTRRGKGTRDSSSVRTLAGGGVVMLGIDGSPADEDEYGSPDPTRTIVRELYEELGTLVERSQVVPVAVYLLNETGPHTTGPGGLIDRETGQLVATVQYVVHLNLSKSRFQEEASYASASHGAYETEGVEFIEMPEPKSPTQSARGTAACTFAERVHALRRELDQRAVIAAVYAAVDKYGLPATYSAFSGKFTEPWYRSQWAEGLETEHPEHDRLVAPIGKLVDEATASNINEFVNAIWPTPPVKLAQSRSPRSRKR